MPSERVVLACASDAGSARVLIPVLRSIDARASRVHVMASGPAQRILSAELAEYERVDIDDGEARSSLSGFMQRVRPDVVVTGAGAYYRLEHEGRLAATRFGIPSVAVLDYWFECAARFHRLDDDGTLVPSWPNFACALDETSRHELAAAGCPVDAIVVTGAANLEESKRRWDISSTTDRGTLEAQFGLASGQPTWAFFSEPYLAAPDGRHLDGPGGLYRADGEPLFGYTASEVLRVFLSTLDRVGGDIGPAPQVLIKAHSLEWTPPLHEMAAVYDSSRMRVRVVEDANPKDVVAVADFVVGMSSVTLIEAALAGKTVFSVQPGLTAAAPFDPCVANRLGLTIAVTSIDQLAGTLTGATEVRAQRPRSDVLDALIDGASERVAEVIVAACAPVNADR